jgi:hypothetical protein
MKIGICSRDFQPKDRGRVRLGYVRRKTRLTAGPGHQRHRRERERESAAAVLGRPTRAREKRLGPVGPAAKTESRPTRVGFHAAGYTGKFFSFVFFFFSFLIFQTHFQIKFS